MAAGPEAGSTSARSAGGPEPAPARPARASWNLAEGAELAPDRHVLSRLGGGTRYEVFLVWDERLFALAVAKALRPDVAADPRARRELRREAGLVARLAHPSLVRGLGAALDGPRPHLLLEHVDGPTLHRLVARGGPLALDQLLPLALHVAAVLHYLHGEGVVHLDVKPGNVVMSGPPRLVDLSIARPVASAVRLRRALGTDLYMAPEQCAPGSAPLGPPADVWGLGATLFHAIAGRPPWERPEAARRSPDPATRWPQLAVAPAPLPDGTPGPLAELVGAMLAREPGRRPAARDVALALEPLVTAGARHA